MARSKGPPRTPAAFAYTSREGPDGRSVAPSSPCVALSSGITTRLLEPGRPKVPARSAFRSGERPPQLANASGREAAARIAELERGQQALPRREVLAPALRADPGPQRLGVVGGH